MTFWIWQLCIAAPFIAADLAGLELESRFSYFWIAYLCSGQLIPDSDLGFSSATAGAIPPL